jgi:hypothetical protein
MRHRLKWSLASAHASFKWFVPAHATSPVSHQRMRHRLKWSRISACDIVSNGLRISVTSSQWFFASAHAPSNGLVSASDGIVSNGSHQRMRWHRLKRSFISVRDIAPKVFASAYATSSCAGLSVTNACDIVSSVVSHQRMRHRLKWSRISVRATSSQMVSASAHAIVQMVLASARCDIVSVRISACDITVSKGLRVSVSSS